MSSDDTIIDTEIKSRVNKSSWFSGKGDARIVQVIVDIIHSISLLIIWMFFNYVDNSVKFRTSLMIITLYVFTMIIINYNTTKTEGITIMPPNNKEGINHLLKSLVSTLNSVLPLVLVLVMLQIFPGWLKPFSNTIGYAIVTKLYPNLIDDLLSNPEDEKFKLNPDNTVAKSLIFKLKNDGYKNFFINNLPGIKSELFDKLNLIQKDTQIFKSDLFENDIMNNNGESKATTLLKAVRLKTNISRLIWMISTLIICGKMNELNLYNLISTDDV
jgi:hypothetical protein